MCACSSASFTRRRNSRATSSWRSTGGLQDHAQNGAIESKRLDAQHARPIHQRRRPIRIDAKIAANFFEDGERASHGFGRWDRHVHQHLRPIAAEIGNLADQAIGNGDARAFAIADHGAAQRDVLHFADFVVDADQIADYVLIFENDEETVDEILDQMLRAET